MDEILDKLDKLDHDIIVGAIISDIMAHPRINKPIIENLMSQALDRGSKKELLDFWDLSGKAVDLLKRWDNADIPDTIWSEPGEDYELPLDTQSFLKGCG